MEQAFGTYNFFYIEICLKQFIVKIIEIDVKIPSFVLYHSPSWPDSRQASAAGGRVGERIVLPAITETPQIYMLF